MCGADTITYNLVTTYTTIWYSTLKNVHKIYAHTNTIHIQHIITGLGITQLQQETSTVCKALLTYVSNLMLCTKSWMHTFSGLGIYLAPISVIQLFLYETNYFIFFFVLFYSFTYCKPFLNIRMGTSCQLSLHDNGAR